MDSIEAEVLTECGKRDGKGRRIIGKEEQERLLCLYDESALTQREFCRREGINYHTFVAWLGRRRKVGGSDGVAGFHQISLVADHHAVAKLEAGSAFWGSDWKKDASAGRRRGRFRRDQLDLSSDSHPMLRSC